MPEFHIPPPLSPPEEPPPQRLPVNRRHLAIGIATAVVIVLAAFGVDVCKLVHSVGVELDACKPSLLQPSDTQPPPASLPSIGDAGVR